MTAAGSIGFLGVIRYRTAFIIGLCTLAAYWFDDLVDLTRDETRVPTLRALRSVRVVLLVIGLSVVTLWLLWLLPRESKQLLVLLACLAILATAFCLRHALAPRPLLGPIPYWAQALGWSAACVLSPQLAAGVPTNLETWLSLGYFLLLIFPVIDLWRNPSPQAAQRVWLLAVQCVVAALMVLLAVGFKWTPWVNIAMIAAPAINLLLLWIRQRATMRSTVVATELTVLFNTLCALLIIGANRSGMSLDAVGPRSPADYFELAAVATLALLIFGNLLLRRSRGAAIVYRGDGFSALIMIGLAIFAFQSLQAACHLQAWLLPWFSTRWFRAAGLEWVGAAIMTASILLFAASYLQLGASWRIGIDEDAAGALVTSGVYRRSRNPIYLAGDLFMAGSFLLDPTLSGLLYLMLTPTLLHRQIIREENFLKTAFGPRYAEYAAATPRYL
jgi:protein-S-isoprenylcysteine O-methyltransferase Ste14